VAEYEPCTGALVVFPFRVPDALLQEIAADANLYVLASAEDSAGAVFGLNTAGVDMSHVELIIAPTNTYLTRDFGPWFVFDGNGDAVILDHAYAAPGRPDDDAIPMVLAQRWALPIVTHDLKHEGGNYMTDGLGLSFSTEFVWTVNPERTPQEIEELLREYYGIDRYVVLPLAGTSSQHIDIWAKLLDEETILVKQVSTAHEDYAVLEERAATLASTIGSYGRPFRVVRVLCPQFPWGPGVAAYTNALILNDKVFVPMFGRASHDSAALQVYRENMPGYEVTGFAHASWRDHDALHCRVLQIPDRLLLRVDHNPIQSAHAGTPIEVRVFVDDRSEAGLDTAATALYWRPVGAPGFDSQPLTPDAQPDWYVATIPPQASGAEVEYYVTAADFTGRSDSRPRRAPVATYRFPVDDVTGVSLASVGGLGAGLHLDAVQPNPFYSSATGRFRLLSPGPVYLRVLDPSGRLVKRLVDARMPAGEHSFTWEGRSDDGRNVASGVYILVLDAAGERASRRAILLRR
jgi:agmatine/peptidylarginine deiminase